MTLEEDQQANYFFRLAVLILTPVVLIGGPILLYRSTDGSSWSIWFVIGGFALSCFLWTWLVEWAMRACQVGTQLAYTLTGMTAFGVGVHVIGAISVGDDLDPVSVPLGFFGIALIMYYTRRYAIRGAKAGSDRKVLESVPNWFKPLV